MTSPSGGFHPTTDSISDLLEGLLPPDEGRATAEHLGQCAQCLAVRDALVRAHDVLQTAGRTPPSIPPDLFDRVEATLRAESQARAQTTGVVSMAAARDRRGGGWKTKVLGVAAAVALLGGGGAVAVQVMQPEQDFAAGDPGESGAAEEPSEGAPPPGGQVNPSIPALTASGFDVGVRGLLKGGPTIGNGEAGAVAPDPLADLHPADSACVSTLLTRAGAGRAIATAETTFDGDEVVLVVTESTEPDSVHGYAIGGCPADTAEVLYDKVVAE